MNEYAKAYGELLGILEEEQELGSALEKLEQLNDFKIIMKYLNNVKQIRINALTNLVKDTNILNEEGKLKTSIYEMLVALQECMALEKLWENIRKHKQESDAMLERISKGEILNG